jgi:hypothetical protein
MTSGGSTASIPGSDTGGANAGGANAGGANAGGANAGGANAGGANAGGANAGGSASTSSTRASTPFAHGSTSSTRTSTVSTSFMGATSVGTSSATPFLLIDDESAAIGAQINAGSALRALVPSGDKLGAWYSYGWNQAAGQALVPPAGMYTFTALNAGIFAQAACVSSAGYIGYSAGEGLFFATVDGESGVSPIVNVDLSGFTGITYWALSTESSAVRVMLPDDQTDSSDPSAACNKQSPSAGSCDDHFTASDQLLTATWTQYGVLFAETHQNGFGAPFTALDTKAVRRLQFEDEGSGLADGGASAFQFCIGPVALQR